MMASLDDIATLRRLIDDTVVPYTYEDTYLEILIDTNTDLNIIAASIWREKAAGYVGLVDVQEGSSRRSLGDLYEQALSMAKFMEDTGGATTGRPGRTRAIERP